MQYNSLGKSGLKIGELSLGSWITFGKQYGVKDAKKLIEYAFDQGVNFFDNAEAYAHGESEVIMGQVLKEFQRKDVVVSTKIFWGGEGPNDMGLSRKHLIEGTNCQYIKLYDGAISLSVVFEKSTSCYGEAIINS